MATLDRPLEFFLLPGCARAEFPSPFLLETWRYSTDWPANRREQRVGAAAEAWHLSILGAWSSKVHNHVQSFCKTDGVSNVSELQQMLQRSRVYLHQLAELCACRYDVLNYDDEEVAAEDPGTHPRQPRRARLQGARQRLQGGAHGPEQGRGQGPRRCPKEVPTGKAGEQGKGEGARRRRQLAVP